MDDKKLILSKIKMQDFREIIKCFDYIKKNFKDLV